MSSNRVTGKLEEAAKILVDALTFAVTRTSNTGVDNDELKLPNVICSAEQGEEYPLNSGNFWIRLRATLNSQIKDTTLANHQADFQVLADKFMEDDIAAQLSATAVTEFHVFGVRGREQGRTIKEQAHSDYIELDVLAASTDIS
jgi:hypothetical protein